MKHVLSYKTTIINLIFLLAAVAAVGQNKTDVKASLDRSQFLIGEQARLRLEADIPENQPIRFFQIDSLPHFEILTREKIDTVNTGRGTVLSQVILITSFDSGHWVIPRLPLGEGISTDSIPVDIGFAPFDPKQPYHDIRDIIEVKPAEEKRSYLVWYIAGAILLLVLLLYFLLRGKEKPVAQVAVAPPNPYADALKQLEELKDNKPASKQYYSTLIDIFRVFVDRKKGIHSLQQTTDDLVTRLRILEMPADKFTRLSQALRLGDFVKFAKYVPTAADDDEAFDAIRQSIQQIEGVA